MNAEVSIAKITRPNLHNIYLRDNFFNILDSCLDKPVIWITSPPGAGKTTLVSSYIESRNLGCLWYQVDRRDTDPATFFHYLGEAAQLGGSRKKISLPHLTPEYLQGLQVFAREYFQQLYKSLKKKSVIVFDNYQEVTSDSALHDLIHAGLGNVPKGLNIIIISRTPPPPILSRMRLNQQMEVITYDDLRLTTEEARGIATVSGKPDVSEVEIHDMLSKTEGWAAGLVLMFGSENRENFSNDYVDCHNASATFKYFAGEFFENLDTELQGFLLKLSVSPIITAEISRELTGDARAERIISRLVQKNHFVQSHFGSSASYQLHPLFREFIYARLRAASSAESLLRLERKGARLLEENGYIDDAVELYHKVGDTEALTSLVCERAPFLLEQGRHETLSNWLGYLPEAVKRSMPWLLFWKGSSYLPYDQSTSRQAFEQAFEDFYADRDTAGVFLSWAGVVDATIHAFDDFKGLDRWINLLDGLIAEFPQFPSKEIEERVSFCMFVALSFRRPQHPSMNLWLDKVCAIAEVTTNKSLLVPINLYLVDYYLWVGDIKRASAITERLSRITSSGHNPPFAKIAIKLTEALNCWYQGDLEQCVETVKKGLEISEKSGVKVFDYFLYGHGVVGTLTGGDLVGAEKYLVKAATVMDERKRFCRSYYHHLVACHKLLEKDLAGALAHEQLALDLAIELGAPFAEAMSRMGLALLNQELGEERRAAEEVALARELAHTINSHLIEYVGYLFEAYFALEAGRKELATDKLREAMALGRRYGFVNFHMWRPDIMARLCILALEEGIEIQYVKKLIEKRGIFPEQAPLGLGNWPWKIKIFVMGQFAIVKDGERMKFGRKVPKKPMEMLKTLIMHGGKNVSVSVISDALWPEAEGDNAHVVFTTTLKRLRSIIGTEDILNLNNGQLTLNPSSCWVDAWEFDYIVGVVEKDSSGGMGDESVRLLEKAVATFADDCSLSSDQSPLALAFNERMRSKLIRCIVKLGVHWEEIGSSERAVDIYKKGLEVDNLCEELYQKLMVCQNRLGQRAEALALFKYLSNLYSDMLGIEPSSKTRKIYQDILNS